MRAQVAPSERSDAPVTHVINVRDAKKHFPVREGILQRVGSHVRAVDGVSFDIRRGETVGLVGESGCGKTTLGRCIAGLSETTDGGVYFRMDDESLRRLDALRAIEPERRTPADLDSMKRLTDRFRLDRMPKSVWRQYRRNCQMVFQDAFSSLNPRHLVLDIVGRPLRIHKEASGTGLTKRVIELLESVGLGRQHLYRYPHQFSGGQRQRVSIARALALDPELIVLDEPTSALDVSVQAQILNLLHRLQKEHGLTYLFISHDLNVVRHMSDRIVVMYLGRICEVGRTEQIFGDPRHPYTEALLAANPGIDDSPDTIRLSGALPDPASPPQGCRFHTRCPVVTERCGWDVSDVLRALEERGNLLDGLIGVERRTAFEGELSFETSDQAHAVAAELGSEGVSNAMRTAQELLEVRDRTVHVRFPPVEEMSVTAVGEDHDTACILHDRGGTTRSDSRSEPAS